MIPMTPLKDSLYVFLGYKSGRSNGPLLPGNIVRVLQANRDDDYYYVSKVGKNHEEVSPKVCDALVADELGYTNRAHGRIERMQVAKARSFLLTREPFDWSKRNYLDG